MRTRMPSSGGGAGPGLRGIRPSSVDLCFLFLKTLAAWCRGDRSSALVGLPNPPLAPRAALPFPRPRPRQCRLAVPARGHLQRLLPCLRPPRMPPSLTRRRRHRRQQVRLGPRHGGPGLAAQHRGRARRCRSAVRVPRRCGGRRGRAGTGL
uniref:Uncharacterized protein n=1 Tax=Triticum urartu TaxID=4572 RepID=A0A8R7QC77_TRIUA